MDCTGFQRPRCDTRAPVAPDAAVLSAGHSNYVDVKRQEVFDHEDQLLIFTCMV